LTLYTITKLKSLQTLEWGILSNKDSSIILDGEDSNKQMTQNNQEWIPFLPASDNGYDPLSESLTLVLFPIMAKFQHHTKENHLVTNVKNNTCCNRNTGLSAVFFVP
jgi:hypothetical protein